MVRVSDRLFCLHADGKATNITCSLALIYGGTWFVKTGAKVRHSCHEQSEAFAKAEEIFWERVADCLLKKRGMQ